MKKFVMACIAFVVILAVVIVHSVTMINLGNIMKELSDKTEKYAVKEDWENVSLYINEIKKEWEKRGLWTALTIKTDEIEQIEISLKQCEKYAKLRAKAKFIGEFTMFSNLVEHIPHQEGFHIEEIL